MAGRGQRAIDAGRRRPLAVILALAASAAVALASCIGGELGTPFSEAKLDHDVHLTSTLPVAVRHLTAVVPPGSGIDRAVVRLMASRVVAADTFEAPDGVTISVRPDDPTTLVSTLGAAEASALPGAMLTFHDCRRGCRGGFSIIVRGAHPTGSVEDIRIFGRLVAAAKVGSATPPATTPMLVDDADLHFDGAPVVARVTAKTEALVSTTEQVVHVDLHVRADRSVVDDARARSAVGSLLVRVVGLGPSHDALASDHLIVGNISAGGRSQGLAPEDSTVDLDWLGLCPASGDCDATIRVDLSYPLMVAAARAHATRVDGSDSPVPGSFRVELESVTMLEAFDGRPVDPGPVTMEAIVSR